MSTSEGPRKRFVANIRHVEDDDDDDDSEKAGTHVKRRQEEVGCKEAWCSSYYIETCSCSSKVTLFEAH